MKGDHETCPWCGDRYIAEKTRWLKECAECSEVLDRTRLGRLGPILIFPSCIAAVVLGPGLNLWPVAAVVIVAGLITSIAFIIRTSLVIGRQKALKFCPRCGGEWATHPTIGLNPYCPLDL